MDNFFVFENIGDCIIFIYIVFEKNFCIFFVYFIDFGSDIVICFVKFLS